MFHGMSGIVGGLKLGLSVQRGTGAPVKVVSLLSAILAVTRKIMDEIPS